MRIPLRPRIALLDFQEENCNPGTGRSLAEDIAERLIASKLFQVVDRNKLSQILGDGELGQEYRFHIGWAAGMIPLIDADAVVLGRVQHLPQDRKTISAKVLDSRGVIFAVEDRSSAEKLAKLLITDRLARTIHARHRSIPAKIDLAIGPSLLLNIGDNSGFQPEDQLRVDSVLEAVLDPYFQEESRIFEHLIASIGEAEVLDVGAGHTLVRYTGNACPKTGDQVALSKI